MACAPKCVSNVFFRLQWHKDVSPASSTGRPAVYRSEPALGITSHCTPIQAGPVETAEELPLNVGMTYLPGTEPLNDDELDLLDEVLARVKGGAIPNAEALDGFFTALVICPDLVKPSEYMEVIKSSATTDDELVFDSMDEIERFHGLLMRHWNAINAELRRGEPHFPVLNISEDGVAHGNDWAKGFLAGVDLRPDAWRTVIDDEERAGPLCRFGLSPMRPSRPHDAALQGADDGRAPRGPHREYGGCNKAAL